MTQNRHDDTNELLYYINALCDSITNGIVNQSTPALDLQIAADDLQSTVSQYIDLL